MMYPHQTGRSPPQNSLKLTLDSVVSGGIGLRVVPYTHSHLDKVQKHFIYTWHGFVKHSKCGLRLNHDVPTSDRSVPTPKFLKMYPRLSGGIGLRVVSYTHSQLIKVQKHCIYIWYGFVKPSKWGLRLNHDVTISDRSVPTPKLTIAPRLRGSIRLRVVPYTHSQLIKVLKHLHTYDRDVGCSLRGFEAQPWCNHIRYVGPHPKIPEHWLPDSVGVVSG
jgi:hypothetical protein